MLATAAIARRPLIEQLHLAAASAAAAANRPARVIAPSLAVADAYVTLGGAPERVRVVPNQVTLESDGAGGVERRVLRTRLGLPVDGFVFGVFSRLSPRKGQEVALRAVAPRPDLCCVVVAGDALFGEHE